MKIEIRFQDFDSRLDDYGRYFLWDADREMRPDTDTFETEREAAAHRDALIAEAEQDEHAYEQVEAWDHIG